MLIWGACASYLENVEFAKERDGLHPKQKMTVLRK